MLYISIFNPSSQVLVKHLLRDSEESKNFPPVLTFHIHYNLVIFFQASLQQNYCHDLSRFP